MATRQLRIPVFWAFVAMGPLAVLLAERANAQLQDDITIVDQNGNSCIDASIGDPTTIFIVAKFEGFGEPPSTIEFQLLGSPAEWLVSVAPGELVSVVIGEVFAGGVQLALSSCDRGTTSAVLFTAQIQPNNLEHAVLTLLAHDTPGSPSFDCPTFRYGGCAPIFGGLCLPPGPRATVNPEGDCALPVTHLSWLAVKSLYK